MSTVTDLTTPLTLNDVRTAIYNVLASTGVTTTTWKPGAVVRTLISAVAIVLVALSSLIAQLAQSAFLPLASGEWLRLVALYVYNVVRIEATFATGFVTLINTGGGVFSATAGQLTFSNPKTGKLYTNTGTVSLGALATLTGIAVAALEVGSLSTSYGGEISVMTTAWTAVTVTNPAPVIGSDTESDPLLRQRCTEKLGALSPNGPADAYRYIARSAVRADGSPIGITRVRVVPDGNGGVNVYLAGPSGAIPGTIGDLTTDLGIIDNAIQRSCVPLCVQCVTASATPKAVSMTYKIYAYNTSGLTDADLVKSATSGLTDYFATAPIGGNVISGAPGTIYSSELSAVVGRARGPSGAVLPIIRVDFTPTTDVPIAPNEVPVLGTVLGSVQQITPLGI